MLDLILTLPDSDSVLGSQVERVVLLNIEQLVPLINLPNNCINADVVRRVDIGYKLCSVIIFSFFTIFVQN